MALTLIGLALYLWLLGKWGKYLKARGTPLRRKRLYGALAAIPMLALSFYYGYNDYSGEAYGIGAFVFTLVWNAAVVILGFITVVYAPKWIVGTPKPVGNPPAK